MDPWKNTHFDEGHTTQTTSLDGNHLMNNMLFNMEYY